MSAVLLQTCLIAEAPKLVRSQSAQDSGGKECCIAARERYLYLRHIRARQLSLPITTVRQLSCCATLLFELKKQLQSHSTVPWFVRSNPASHSKPVIFQVITLQNSIFLSRARNTVLQPSALSEGDLFVCYSLYYPKFLRNDVTSSKRCSVAR